MSHPPIRAAHRRFAAVAHSRPSRRALAGMTVVAIVAAGSVALAAPASAAPGDPVFGPNVTIIEPGTSAADVNSILTAAGSESEFSTNRHAIFFKPGTYGTATNGGTVQATLGYYEGIYGLGSSPDDVTINGKIQGLDLNGSALTNFWRTVQNLKINSLGTNGSASTLNWAVSQAAPFRRLDVTGSLLLCGSSCGYSSGGYLADSRVSGQISSGSQQQWYTRDSTIGSWNGGVWNMVFSGVTGAPADSFPDSATTGNSGNKFTTLASTPISREAPFLTWNATDGYSVYVPDARTNTSGAAWTTGADTGTSLPISNFYIAQPSDTAATINAQLTAGKNLIVTPGVYSLDAPLNITRNDTVVLGLGMATLVPTAGNAVITTGDVTGVKIAGISVDAATPKSDVLIQVGPSNASHVDAADPITLQDVFIRIGGPHAGQVGTAIVVNSDNVLLDDIWSWRADHGTGVGWTANTADHGLVVNGDNVTAEGLFVEHYQQNQVLWNGNGGTTIFFQNETPYDVPSQAAWMDGTKPGYASYKVADTVTSHHAYGVGIYSYFNQGIDIRMHSAIDTPVWSTVQFTHVVGRFLNGSGGINNVINNDGLTVLTGTDAAETKYVRSFPPDGTPAPPPPNTDNQETITATIPEAPGEFSWSIDAADHSVALGTAVNNGDYWEATGSLKPVAVTDTRAGGPAWSVSGQISDFSGGLDGKYLGWSPTVATAGAGAVAGAVVGSGFASGNGLKDASVLGSALDGHAKGTGSLGAGLDLRVPADTDAGTYTATLTLTALS